MIGALDVELETYLKDIAPQLGVRIAILSLNSGLTTGDYGWNTPAFKRMAKFKFLPVQAGLPPPRATSPYHSPILMTRTIPSHQLLEALCMPSLHVPSSSPRYLLSWPQPKLNTLLKLMDTA